MCESNQKKKKACIIDSYQSRFTVIFLFFNIYLYTDTIIILSFNKTENNNNKRKKQEGQQFRPILIYYY